MNTQIPAIFTEGIFRPLVPVAMAEGTHVQMAVSEVEIEKPPGAEIQGSWQEFLKQVEQLPDDSPRDGLSNRDHDKIIYGK